MSATLLALLAGAFAALALAELAMGAPRVAGEAGALVDSVLRLGREGREPGAVERRRLILAGAGCALIVGWVIAGPLTALAAGGAGPWLAARVLRARRERYRRAAEAGAPQIAQSLADALGGGHSLRGAVVEAAQGMPGAAGHELRRTAAELRLGARTEEALEALRERVRSDAIDAIVAAALLQRRAGGDLATLLRGLGASFEDAARLRGEVRAATAQARFTGLVVFLLPLAGGLLAELASPGYLRSLAGSFLTAWLAGIALVLQIAAAFAIRRLGRVKE